MEQTLEFTRGDTYKFKFKRIDKDGNIITTPPKKIYFTVKTSWSTDEVIFQKTLVNGIVFSSDDNYFHVTINPEDTSDIPYYDYVFDIEVVEDDYTQTIAKGILKLEKESTFIKNEV